MSLSAIILSNEMKSATEGKTNANSALLAMGNAIGTYITQNTQIIFSWSAQIPPAPPAIPSPIPDPVVVANGGLKGFAPILTPSNLSQPKAGLKVMSNQIISAMMATQAMITDPGFATSPIPMASAPAISSLVLDASGNNRDIAMLQLATQICNWVLSCVTPTPTSGVHNGVYIGTGAMTTIL